MGCGVSGGEDGARYGPSLMPGGAEEAWPHVKDIFQVYINVFLSFAYIMMLSFLGYLC